MIGEDKIAALVVSCSKPYGEDKPGEHVYWILINGSFPAELYTPDDKTNRN